MYLYNEVEGVSQTLVSADLIYGQQIIGVANGHHYEVTSTAQSLTKRAKYQFKLLLNQFTKRWRQEYLLGLGVISQRHSKG